MSTTATLTAENLIGYTLIDDQGRDVGKIDDLYVDPAGRPHWLLVDTGLFGAFLSVVPTASITLKQDKIAVPYDMEKLTGAPNVTHERPIALHREGLLYDYYRLTAPRSVAAATHKGDGDDLLKPPSELCRFSSGSCPVYELTIEAV